MDSELNSSPPTGPVVGSGEGGSSSSISGKSFLSSANETRCPVLGVSLFLYRPREKIT